MLVHVRNRVKTLNLAPIVLGIDQSIKRFKKEGFFFFGQR